jgi:uncharacterized membrane protein (DUF4010 family)
MMDTLLSPEQQQVAVTLAMALAIGLLFGLERGWHRDQPDYASRPAGLRTFALIGLLGGTAGVLAQYTTPSVLGWAFAGLAAAVVSGHILSVRETGDTGITTMIAALVAFALAAMAALGLRSTAASAAVVATLLLGLKPRLHGWLEKLNERELLATLQLLLISVVMLPILPNEGYGPADALNPYELWWMVVLIAAISYAGYFAVRIAGPGAGVPLTGLLAGLASSTALTLQLARLAGPADADRNLLATGILLANATLFPRILIIVGLVQPQLIAPLMVPMGIMTLLTALPASVLWLRRGSTPGDSAVDMENPLALGSALRFGLLLAIVVLAGRLAAEHFGNAGVVLLALVSGVADLNAITLSVARMVPKEVGQSIAVFSILLAITSNALFKTGVCLFVGTPGLALRVGLPLGSACAAALASLWIQGGIELPAMLSECCF